MEQRRRRLRDFRIRKTDVMFILGIGLVIGEAVGSHAPDNTMVFAGLTLMGVSVGSRIASGNGDDKKNGDKP